MGSYLAHGPKIYPKMRTLGPSLASLAQSSWSLLSNTLGGVGLHQKDRVEINQDEREQIREEERRKILKE